jgi:primosomal protein N' (replication factor Y)
MEGIDGDLFLRTVGPVPAPPPPGRPVERDTGHLSGDGASRLLLFFSYRDAAHAVGALRTRRAVLSAKRTTEPVSIRCDALDLL